MRPLPLVTILLLHLLLQIHLLAAGSEQITLANLIEILVAVDAGVPGLSVHVEAKPLEALHLDHFFVEAMFGTPLKSGTRCVTAAHCWDV